MITIIYLQGNPQVRPGEDKMYPDLHIEVETIYLWSGTNGYAKKSPIAWDALCQCKFIGDLNIIQFELWKKKQLASCFEPLLRRRTNFRVLWIHTYYLKGGNINDFVEHIFRS